MEPVYQVIALVVLLIVLVVLLCLIAKILWFSPPRRGRTRETVQDYLDYLGDSGWSVVGSDRGWHEIVKGEWSLPATADLARQSTYRGQHSNFQPFLRAYLKVGRRGAWFVHDRGENARVVQECFRAPGRTIRSFLVEYGRLGKMLDGGGRLRVKGRRLEVFKLALQNFAETVVLMDEHFSAAVWRCLGPIPDIRESDGARYSFSGSGSNLRRRTNGGSFVLGEGPAIVDFACAPTSGRRRSAGTVKLVRDDPGVFDSATTIFELEGYEEYLGVLLVCRKRWHDPEPGVSYHLEVDAPSDWQCEFLQIRRGLGMSKFPQRAGLPGGAAVLGPIRTNRRRVKARIQHQGSGQFNVSFISSDGSHVRVPGSPGIAWLKPVAAGASEVLSAFDHQGLALGTSILSEFVGDQDPRIEVDPDALVGEVHITGVNLNLESDTEYMIEVWGDGPWLIELYED